MVREVCTLSLPSFETFPILSSLFSSSDRSLLDDLSSSFQLLSHFSYSLGVPCHSLVLQPNNPYGFSECHLEKCPWIYFTRKGPTALLVSLSFLVRH